MKIPIKFFKSLAMAAVAFMTTPIRADVLFSDDFSANTLGPYVVNGPGNPVTDSATAGVSGSGGLNLTTRGSTMFRKNFSISCLELFPPSQLHLP